MRIGVVIGNPGGHRDSISALVADYPPRPSRGSVHGLDDPASRFRRVTLMASWDDDDGPELGTAVIPGPDAYPVVLAEQALTTNALTGGRLTLGLGLAHSATLESLYGLSPRRSVGYLADYLDTLEALLSGTKSLSNQTFRFSARIGASGLPAPPPVLIAALGPRMLQLAGQRTAGRSPG